MTDVLHRFERDPYVSGRVAYLQFPVIRKTPKGYWCLVCGKETFCLSEDGKRYAHDTIQRAFTSFAARTERRRLILLAHLSEVEALQQYALKHKDNLLLGVYVDPTPANLWSMS